MQGTLHFFRRRASLALPLALRVPCSEPAEPMENGEKVPAQKQRVLHLHVKEGVLRGGEPAQGAAENLGARRIIRWRVEDLSTEQL